MAENDTAKLLASALDIKNKSRLIANPNDYILVIVKGGLDPAFNTKDPSFMGTFWLERLFSPTDSYMIFGPTEGQREFGGDQQKIINHYSLRQNTNVKVYITKSLLEIITIIHAKMASITESALENSGTILEKRSFGLLVGKNDIMAIPISGDDLPKFSAVVQNFLER